MGARLGRYVVLKHLATGGMADVLLGRTDGIEGFERHVVVKRIRPEHARDQRFIRMFLDEARVAANLHHQHIVQVHDVGEAAGEYFIAMEYLHGEDVRTILSTASRTRSHVPLGHAVAIVSAAAAGLHYAHERRGSDKRPLGIVHCDVSPSNILVGYDGSIKVVDFGIAKATMRQETRSGGLEGKVSYMSPEQCKTDDIDRRSDVYSLGVVLYELATTTRLFKGENDYLVMDQIVNGRVALPQVRRPDLPNELSAIIMRALAPDPERRYFTAEELRVALDQFAGKSGLTTSTSAIAGYMRKQFGERPEPWLDLGGRVVRSLGDVATSVGEADHHSWTELPRSDDNARRSSGAIPRASGLIGVGMPAAAPTDSKMGWESQQPARAPRGVTPAKLALICAPLIVILGVAIWRLAGMGSTTSPTAAIAARSAALPPPSAAAPTVTPISEPALAHVAAEVPAVRASAPAAAPSPVAARPSEPPPPAPPRRSPAVAKRPSTARTAGASPPSPTPGTSPNAASRLPHASSAATVSGTPAGAGSSAGQAAAAAHPPSPAAPVATAPGPTVASAPAPAVAPAAPAVAAPPPAAAPPPVVAPVPVAVDGRSPERGGGDPAGSAGGAGGNAARGVDVAPPQLSHGVIDRIASDHTRELSRCDGGEELHGEITVKFAVDAAGKVTKAQVATALKKPKVAACILRALQKWEFPRQGPIGAQGTYTLSFQ